MAKVVESCLKEEVKVCLQEELRHYLLEIEEMNKHFKRIEDNIKRIEMMSLRMQEERRVCDGHINRETVV